MRRNAQGELQGDRIEPLEYTGKWVKGVKAYRKAIKAEVARANGLKGGGQWQCTQHYSATELAELPGGCGMTMRHGGSRRMVQVMAGGTMLPRSLAREIKR